MTDAPAGRTARCDILLSGSLGDRTVGTCFLIRDGSIAIVVDPGLAPSQAAMLDPPPSTRLPWPMRASAAHGAAE